MRGDSEKTWDFCEILLISHSSLLKVFLPSLSVEATLNMCHKAEDCQVVMTALLAHGLLF